MRVAMLGPFAVGRPIQGGIEAVAAALIDGLASIGVEVDVVTVADSDCVYRAAPGVTVHTVRSSGRWQRPTLYLQERRALTRRLRSLDPDVVHVQGQNFYGIAGMESGLPTVVTLHGMLHREAAIVDQRSALSERVSKRLRGIANTRFERLTLRRAQRIIVINPYVAASIEGGTGATLYAIDNPIDDAYFDVEDRHEAARIFFAGALEPRKRVHDIIDAVSHLAQRGRYARLRIAGRSLDEGYAASLRAQVGACGLEDRVNFLGVIPQESIYEEYARAAVVVMASEEETSPMLIQQAMAAGRPVVATRVGGVPHLVRHGVTGLMTPRGDSSALADGIESVLADDALRASMGRAARAEAEARFRRVEVARRTLEVYADAIGADRPVAPVAAAAGGR